MYTQVRNLVLIIMSIINEIKTDPPDPCHDVDYYVIADGTRSSSYASDHYFSDQSGHSYTSPDWHGPNWYRIVSPAGSRLPETLVESRHCNSFEVGWLNGTHPTMLGETVVRTVCFNNDGHICWRKILIEIQHCGNYFLYLLPDTPGTTPARYCAE